MKNREGRRFRCLTGSARTSVYTHHPPTHQEGQVDEVTARLHDLQQHEAADGGDAEQPHRLSANHGAHDDEHRAVQRQVQVGNQDRLSDGQDHSDAVQQQQDARNRDQEEGAGEEEGDDGRDPLSEDRADVMVQCLAGLHEGLAAGLCELREGGDHMLGGFVLIRDREGESGRRRGEEENEG